MQVLTHKIEKYYFVMRASEVSKKTGMHHRACFHSFPYRCRQRKKTSLDGKCYQFLKWIPFVINYMMRSDCEISHFVKRLMISVYSIREMTGRLGYAAAMPTVDYHSRTIREIS